MSTTQTDYRSLPIAALIFSQTPMQIERRQMRTKEQIANRAESMKAVGVLEPIIVRGLDTGDGREFYKFEVAAGEGRVLSAQQAGLAEIPAIVRELTDEQVEEIQLIENLQRDDVHELVEARGYETLLKRGHSAEEIAAQVGKSRRTIYTRLQLLKLDPATREAFLRGDLDASKALLVARIPVASLQRKAGGELKAMNYADARGYIEREYMLRLNTAPFDTKDPTLLANTPACGPCPKRTGNQPELFEDVKGADICTDTGCFRAKCEAGAKLKLALARANGQQIISGADAKRVKPYSHSDVISGGYARPSDTCSDDPKRRTYAQILGKDHVPALLQDPNRKAEVIEVVAKADAVKKLKAAGVIKPVKRASTTKGANNAQRKAASDKVDRKKAIDDETEKRLLLQVRAKDGGKITAEHLGFLLGDFISMGDYDWTVGAEVFGFSPKHYGPDCMKQLAKLSEAKLARAFIDACYLLGLSYQNAKVDLLRIAAQRLKIDEKKIREEVKASLKAPAPAKPAAKKASRK